jgi:hypothetical protein
MVERNIVVLVALMLCAGGGTPVLGHPVQESAVPSRPATKPAVREVDRSAIVRERSLIDRAIGVEGDAGAHLLLRLLETRTVKDRRLRLETCDVVRSKLPDATEPFPLLCADGAYESREVERFGALRHLRVDAISLRCRLALQLLELDRRAARELLLELPPGLDVPESQCREVLMPTARVFYDTLATVLGGSMSNRERREGLQWQIARRYLAAVQTPLDIGAACGMVVALEPPGIELDLMVGDLADAIARMPGSSRAIADMTGRPGAGPRVAALLAMLEGRNEARRELCAAMRGLVVRSLEAPRCADAPGDLTAVALEHFNEQVLAGKPIAADEIKSPAVGDWGREQRLYESPASRRILEEIKALHAAQKSPSPDAAGDQARAFDACLSKVRSWNAVEERSDGDYVTQKAYCLSALIRVAPDYSRRLEAVREFVAITRHISKADPPDFVVLMQTLFVMAELDATERRLMLEMLRSAGAPVLSAYAALQLEGVDVFGLTPS